MDCVWNRRLLLCVAGLALSGCGLSDVGPETDKLARWRQQLKADAGTDSSGGSVDVVQGDTDAPVPDAPVPDAKGCEISACEAQDRCRKWACTANGCEAGAKVVCDDGDACTDDTCLPADGCKHVVNVGATCDDGDVCTLSSCQKSVDDGPTCQVTSKVNCDDDNPCTTDTCDPKSGCSNVANTDPCDDGDACTTSVCDQEACKYKAKVDCDDGNVCTDDSCDKQSGCAHKANAAACDDGSVCTKNACAASACAVKSTLDCDDKDACTDDSCDAKKGCQHTHNQAPCDDGKACTTLDTCAQGSCVGKEALFDAKLPLGGYVGAAYGVAPLPGGRMLVAGGRYKEGQNVSAAAIDGVVWQTSGAGAAAATVLQVASNKQLVLQGFVPLPSGATVVYGGRFLTSKDPGAWVGVLPAGGTQVTFVDEVKVKDQFSAWTSGSALAGDTYVLGGFKLTTVVTGSKYISGVVVQFRDAKHAPSATHSHESASGTGLDSVSVVADLTKGPAAYLCVANDDQATIGHVTAKGGFDLWRKFGGKDSNCSGLTVLANGDLFVVGKVGKAERAAWWRLRPNGAVVASWRRPGDKSSFTSLARAPDGSLLVAGLVTPESNGDSHRMVTRVHRDLVQQWETSLPTKADYQPPVIAWHPDGFAVLASSISYPEGSKKSSDVALTAVDAWGYLSCAAAGKCASASLANCNIANACVIVSCEAKAGCTEKAREGSCDDGKPCSTGGTCVKGFCKAGNPRFWQAAVPVAVGAKSPWVGVADAGAGSAVVATLDGPSAEVKVAGLSASGAVAWSKTLDGNVAPPPGGVPHFIVATGDTTWVGGGAGGADSGGWIVGLDGQGKPITLMKAKGETTGWTAAVGGAPGAGAAPELLAVGRIAVQNDARPVLRRWSAAGKQLSQTLMVKSDTLNQSQPLAVARRGAGALVLLRGQPGSTAELALVGIDAKGSVGVVFPFLSAKVGSAGKGAVSLFSRADGGAAVVFGQQSASDAAAKLLITAPAGGLRHVGTPFSALSGVTAPAALLDHGGALLLTRLTAAASASASEFVLGQTNQIGAAATAEKVKLDNFKAAQAAVASTPDGAVLLAARGTHPLTGFVRLEVRRMSVWGHTSCKDAGKCGSETAQTCTSGDDCQRGTCEPKAGCVATSVAPSSCDAGDLCAGAMQCVKGACAGGKPVNQSLTPSCDDDDPCTADSCESGVGCLHSPISSGSCP